MNKILYTPFASYHIIAHHINNDICLFISSLRCYFGCLMSLFCHSMIFSPISPYYVASIQQGRREHNDEK